MQANNSGSRCRAILIGGLCSISYLAVYIARNVLSTVSPQMIGSGLITTETIGSLSSIYFITYAIGQLINGIIGDWISPKAMISLGLVLAGIGNFAFTVPGVTASAAYIAYGLTGFFLSMIFAPMVRVIAENTEADHATKCSISLTVASFLGSPVAGFLAAFIAWQGVFAASSIALVVMGIGCFLLFTVFERKGIVQYASTERTHRVSGGIQLLLRHRIILYTAISILTGVIRTTVVFWLPTYLSQHLRFPADTSALIFTGASLVILLSAFLAELLYALLNRNMELTCLVSFLASGICFFAVYFLENAAANIAFLVMAILFSNCAANMLWNRYCPSLKDTGMVSSATGFLDFVSYMAASISSTMFANAVSDIGWGNLILIWFGLMLVGTVVSIPLKKHGETNIQSSVS